MMKEIIFKGNLFFKEPKVYASVSIFRITGFKGKITLNLFLN